VLRYFAFYLNAQMPAFRLFIFFKKFTLFLKIFSEKNYFFTFSLLLLTNLLPFDIIIRLWC